MRKRIVFRGQSLLEFAITIPMLLLLLMGIFDLGRVTFYYAALTNSAREGARYGIVQPDDSIGIRQVVRDFAFGIDPDDLTISVDRDTELNLITVSTSFEFVPATPLITPFLGGSDGIFLQSETTMAIEG
ncbi:MAG: pilus assembly protein [Anaerolineae bacterium]|nr:pilus assembly protein [Anaerolineae bacterium]